MNSGDWVEDMCYAHDFKRGTDAITFARKNELKSIEFLYSFPESRYDFAIPYDPNIVAIKNRPIIPYR